MATAAAPIAAPGLALLNQNLELIQSTITGIRMAWCKVRDDRRSGRKFNRDQWYGGGRQDIDIYTFEGTKARKRERMMPDGTQHLDVLDDAIKSRLVGKIGRDSVPLSQMLNGRRGPGRTQWRRHR